MSNLIALNEAISNECKILENDASKLPKGVLCRVRRTICEIDKKNQNNRVYERALWHKVLNDETFKKKLENRQILGEAEHPQYVQIKLSPNNTSHVISNMFIDESSQTVKADFDILPTDAGKFVYVLLEAGVQVGASTRAEGELEEAINEHSGEKYMRVKPETYVFATIDHTGDPSCFGTHPENIIKAVEKSYESHVVNKDLAVALLENFKTEDAKKLCDAIRNDKQHEDCNSHVKNKHCNKCKKHVQTEAVKKIGDVVIVNEQTGIIAHIFPRTKKCIVQFVDKKQTFDLDECKLNVNESRVDHGFIVDVLDDYEAWLKKNHEDASQDSFIEFMDDEDNVDSDALKDAGLSRGSKLLWNEFYKIFKGKIEEAKDVNVTSYKGFKIKVYQEGDTWTWKLLGGKKSYGPGEGPSMNTDDKEALRDAKDYIDSKLDEAKVHKEVNESARNCYSKDHTFNESGICTSCDKTREQVQQEIDARKNESKDNKQAIQKHIDELSNQSVDVYEIASSVSTKFKMSISDAEEFVANYFKSVKEAALKEGRGEALYLSALEFAKDEIVKGYKTKHRYDEFQIRDEIIKKFNLSKQEAEGIVEHAADEVEAGERPQFESSIKEVTKLNIESKYLLSAAHKPQHVKGVWWYDTKSGEIKISKESKSKHDDEEFKLIAHKPGWIKGRVFELNNKNVLLMYLSEKMHVSDSMLIDLIDKINLMTKLNVDFIVDHEGNDLSNVLESLDDEVKKKFNIKKLVNEIKIPVSENSHAFCDWLADVKNMTKEQFEKLSVDEQKRLMKEFESTISESAKDRYDYAYFYGSVKGLLRSWDFIKDKGMDYIKTRLEDMIKRLDESAEIYCAGCDAMVTKTYIDNEGNIKCRQCDYNISSDDLQEANCVPIKVTDELVTHLLKKLNVKDVDAEQFKVGLQREQEHLNSVGCDLTILAKMVIDHLKEDANYYLKESAVTGFKAKQDAKKFKSILECIVDEQHSSKLIWEFDRDNDAVMIMDKEDHVLDRIPLEIIMDWYFKQQQKDTNLLEYEFDLNSLSIVVNGQEVIKDLTNIVWKFFDSSEYKELHALENIISPAEVEGFDRLQFQTVFEYKIETLNVSNKQFIADSLFCKLLGNQKTKKTINVDRKIESVMADAKLNIASEEYAALKEKNTRLLENYVNDINNLSVSISSLTHKYNTEHKDNEHLCAEISLIKNKLVNASENIKKMNTDFEIKSKEVESLTQQYELQIKECNDKIASLSAKLEESKVSKQKELLNKYLQCKIDMSGISISEAARALLEHAKTEKEIDDLFEQHCMSAIHGVHFIPEIKSVSINEQKQTSQQSSLTKKINDNIEHAFNGIFHK